MKRTTLSLAAGAVALAALTGFASLTAPSGSADTGAQSPARLPVERWGLLCPAPSNSDLAQTTYTAFTPKGTSQGAVPGKPGTAVLSPAVPPPADTGAPSPSASTDKAKDDKAKDGKGKDGKDKKPADKPAPDKPVIALKEPGKPAAATANGADAPALTGSADGLLAPGWAAQQTTQITGGAGRALLGTSCTAPDADFWFPGASTAKDRQDYVHLTNPDDTAAVADIELFGKDGVIKADIGEGITIPAKSSVPVLLSTLTGTVADDLTVHVSTRAGRVGAVVQATDAKAGADWLPASADAAASQVLPGIPGDATDVRLIVHAKGADDADLKVKLMGKGGGFTPAGLDTVHVKSGMTASFDLKNVMRGEAGSLLLTPVSDAGTPVVAALRVVRGTGDKQEIAFIPATAPVGTRSTATDNRDKAATLALTAPGTKDATVKITSSAGTEGGEPQSKTYTVKAGTTLAVDPPVPAGLKGSYALTVEPDPNGGPVYASRTLAITQDGVPMFTVQTLADDKGTVAVPAASQDLSVLER